MTQSAKAEMYANITAHGNRLNAIFNTGLDPVDLCKKLFRLENKAHRLIHFESRTGVDTTLELTKVITAVRKILFPDAPKDLRTYAKLPLWLSIQIDGNPRGNALKILDRPDLDLPKFDDGCDCIIAPDFTPSR